jgi:hypothetical protein
MTKANETDDHSFRTGKYRFRPPFVTPAHPDEVAFSWLTYDLSRYFFEFMRWSRLSEQSFRVGKWNLCQG